MDPLWPSWFRVEWLKALYSPSMLRFPPQTSALHYNGSRQPRHRTGSFRTCFPSVRQFTVDLFSLARIPQMSRVPMISAFVPPFQSSPVASRVEHQPLCMAKMAKLELFYTRSFRRSQCHLICLLLLLAISQPHPSAHVRLFLQAQRNWLPRNGNLKRIPRNLLKSLRSWSLPIHGLNTMYWYYLPVFPMGEWKTLSSLMPLLQLLVVIEKILTLLHMSWATAGAATWSATQVGSTCKPTLHFHFCCMLLTPFLVGLTKDGPFI